MAASGNRHAIPQIHMDGVAYFQCRFTPPFRVRVPVGEHWLLYRIGGAPVMFSAGDAQATTVLLETGAVVALSGVLQHQFFSSPAQSQAATAWREEPFSGRAEPGEVLIVAGRISKTQMATLPMYKRLLIIQPSAHPDLIARFARVFAWIADEAARPGAVSQEIIRRLAEITTLEIGRAEDEMKAGADGEMPHGVADLRIVRAISAFYAAPQERWSVQRLADIAGMSRTAFALRYRNIIGATPLKTIRQLRMQLARNQLDRPAATPTVESLSKTAGYGSDAAFIRAFAREFGVTPGKVRTGRPNGEAPRSGKV